MLRLRNANPNHAAHSEGDGQLVEGWRVNVSHMEAKSGCSKLMSPWSDDGDAVVKVSHAHCEFDFSKAERRWLQQDSHGSSLTSGSNNGSVVKRK